MANLNSPSIPTFFDTETSTNPSKDKMATSDTTNNQAVHKTGTETIPDVIVVKEGKAEILFPSSNEVFYNPVQEFNRDMSTAVISLYAEEQLKKQSTKAMFGTRKDYEEHQTKESQAQMEVTAGDSSDVTAAVTAGDSSDVTAAVTAGDSSDVTAGGESASNVDSKPGSDIEHQAFIGEKCENGIRILEGLSASGLRSIRYAKEIPGVKEVIANDFAHKAVENIKRNVKHNEVEDRVIPNHGDAGLLMYQNRSYSNRFDVIDLDPYGTAAPFLDGAVQAVKDGGLLCITCTDMAVLCGNHAEACYGKYGAMSLQTKYCHEMAIRIVLHSIELSANRYHRYIVPILSLSVDFYVRMFVRVYTSAATVKLSASKQALVYHCIGCSSFHLQRMGKVTHRENKPPKFSAATGPPVERKCENCGGVFKVGGPVWAEPIHNTDFVSQLLDHVQDYPERFKTSERMNGVLSVISEELPDCPLHYTVSHLCNIIHSICVSQLKFRSALLHAGYRVSITHTSAEAIKTDASNLVVWDIMRAWEKLNPVNKKKLSETSPATAILKKEPSIQVCFDVRPDANPKSRQQRLSRFPDNPEANWGPKARAKSSSKHQETLVEKRARLQGKTRTGQKEKDEMEKRRKDEEKEDINSQAKKQKKEADEDETEKDMDVKGETDS
ncbi:tRNA (guanine(26)-N(2))-dimethyltransferase-like isoform X2 [Amphiura filiformis]|uniref:tRNA (guanine(26)-N(2))-dimethyltransferase-like isoform X2 n=1 Tax=Amphiura filiformis TaxID=82378 RepID=UPI003B215C0B